MTTTTADSIAKSVAEREADRIEAQKARAYKNGGLAFDAWLTTIDGSLRLARMVADGDVPIPEAASDTPPCPPGLGVAANCEHGTKHWRAGFLTACRAYVEAKAGGA